MANLRTAPPRFRALIVEDHDFQRQIAARVLSGCGSIEVIEAGDGTRALELIDTSSTAIDLILCDLNMPNMDGLAFLRHIGERGSKSSVVLASALNPSILRAVELMAKSYGLRILGVVAKPLSRAKLLPLILRHFSRDLIVAEPPPPQMSAAEITFGLERREFVPYFQPIVNLRSRVLVGVEALMRWCHPDLGVILPGAFIPVMEANGLISGATVELIGAALLQCRRWREIGLDVPVAVNTSVESLRDPDLAIRLEEMTRAAGLTPSALTLEITETVAMTDLGRSLETLARCRMKGFGLSIDDYGTGFSSMHQLTRLPVTELKIDRTFVTGAAKEDVLVALIETTVAMSRRLGLMTVAEGVETGADWDTVARLGCDKAQGHFIAAPMPGDVFCDWYTTWPRRNPPRPSTTKSRSTSPNN